MKTKLIAVPKLTHQQYLILKVIGNERKSGVKIREKIICSLASFYLITKRMERKDIIEGEYISHGNYNERIYWVTNYGRKLIREIEEFYEKPDSLGL